MLKVLAVAMHTDDRYTFANEVREVFSKAYPLFDHSVFFSDALADITMELYPVSSRRVENTLTRILGDDVFLRGTENLLKSFRDEDAMHYVVISNLETEEQKEMLLNFEGIVTEILRVGEPSFDIGLGSLRYHSLDELKALARKLAQSIVA